MRQPMKQSLTTDAVLVLRGARELRAEIHQDMMVGRCPICWKPCKAGVVNECCGETGVAGGVAFSMLNEIVQMAEDDYLQVHQAAKQFRAAQRRQAAKAARTV